MAGYFKYLGGDIITSQMINTLDELPKTKAVLLDITPRQLMNMAGSRLGKLYHWQLKKFRYGPGVFKVDFALDGPVPWINEQWSQTGVLHLGGTIEEVMHSENQVWFGTHPEKPFVLAAQQSLFDNTRAPEGKHTLWAYCHVPHGSTVDMTQRIENVIESFAPGFKDRILARSKMSSMDYQQHNPNYVGGDINGGIQDWRQLFTRPVITFSPYYSSIKGVYLCSSSTPPGGGVHGMCGYHAARNVLKSIFGMAPEQKI
jgi:phytoene dehydrogenase-like protein